MSKILAFDLDDTLCRRDKKYENLGWEKYNFCEPIIEMIEKVNHLYDKGYTIYIYTARGMNQFNGDVNVVHNKLFDLTEKSLNKWGIKYHKLIMGKLHYDYLIDDKSMSLGEFISYYDKF